MNTPRPSVPQAIRDAWRHLPASHVVDVLVVGGGPAGCAAAIAAAREGANTLLIERYGFLGGMGTAGLVPAFCPFTDKQKPILKGIALSILEEMKSAMPHLPRDLYDWVPIDPEALKVAYEQRVMNAGATILFLTHCVDAICDENGVVQSVVVHNKSGLQRIEPRVVIDCSGDADVAVAAGAAYEKGDPDTGELQPCTMCFVLAGIDNTRLQAWLWANNAENLLLKPAIAAAKAAGDLQIAEEGANLAYQSPTTIGLNFSHVFDVDATDAAQLSKAHVTGRKLVRHLVEFIRKYCPGCEHAFLVNSGVQIGVRETRRVVGDYVLTLDDYLARRSFDDEIARNAYYIDIHLSQKQWDAVAGGKNVEEERTHQYQPGESHGVPYRCLVPKDLRNVLVAGRCISTDRAVQGSTRVMPMCLAMGEAAGCAAALALHCGARVRDFDVQELRSRLRHWGQHMPEVS